MPGKLWDKVIDHTDEPVVQCNVPAVKDASLDDNNNDCKWILWYGKTRVTSVWVASYELKA